MARFLETFSVVESDGSWSRGPQPVDTLSPGVSIATYDICNPEKPTDPPIFEIGQDATPFAIKAYAKVPTMCAPDEMRQYVENAMADATEYTVTSALWDGAEGSTSEFYLNGDDVTEVARASDMFTSLGIALHKAYEKTPFIKPVIHLGFTSAMALQLGLQNLGLPFVVAPGYPRDAIAITGPVTVRLGSIDTTTAVETDDNRLKIESTRLARIEFDPHMAVRVESSSGS